MKNILVIAIFCITALGYSQDTKPTYEVEGDLVKATYYYDNGAVSTQGFFKDKKLTGKWVRFDKEGNKTQMAFYKEGKKTGKWFLWNEGSLKEVSYNNNKIESVNLWKADSKVAVNK